jgi:tape measure domain-containing protein
VADGDVSLRYRLLGSDEGASRAMDKVGRSAQGLHTRMTAVGVAIGGLAAGGIAALGALGVGAVKTGLETASGLQQAEIGFTTMTGSAVKAKAFVGQLATFAAATPFEMPGLVDAARTLMGVGVSAKQVIPTLTAYGDAAGALGIQQDAFQRIMIAVSQSISAGKIKLGDMNQLANNGLPVWKLLSEAMHKPVPEIQAMISHGQLLSADVLPKLQAQMTKDYGGSMAKQSQTLGGLWSTMTDTFRLGMANVLMPLVPLLQAVLPGAMTALGNAFKGLADGVRSGIGFFQQIGPSLNKAFGDPKTTSDVNALRATVSKAFSQIWAAVGPVLRQIWQTIQTQVVPAWMAFEKAMIPVVNFFVRTLAPKVKVTMAAVLSVIDGALKIIAGLFNILAGLLSGDWSRMWAGIKQVASGAWQAIGGIFRAGVATVTGIFGVLVGALRKLGSNIMQGLLEGIGKAKDAVLGKISEIANGIKDKFASVLHIFSPSRVMMKLGRDVINGVTEGLKQAAPQAYATIEAFAKRIGDMKVTAGVKSAIQDSAITNGAILHVFMGQLDTLRDKTKDQRQAFDDLVKARNDYANSLTQGITGGGSIAGIQLAKDETDSEGNVTKKADKVGSFVADLKAKAEAIRNFNDNVSALRAAGLSQAVLQQIQAAGLETGGALATALTAATPDAIKSINDLGTQITDQSTLMGKGWASDMYDSGIKAAKGLLQGLQSEESQILKAIRQLAQNMVAEIKRTLKIKSPSGVMADEVGAMIPAGLVAGIQGGAGGVASAMRSLVAIPSMGARIGLGGSIAATGGGGGDTHVHLHVQHGIVGDPAQVGAFISEAIRRSGARGSGLTFA